MRKNSKTKQLATMAMLAAVAYIVMLLAHLVPVFSFIPAVPFLKYDPKDVVIVIAGFMMGPMSAFLISIVVSLIEMVTISTTGIIGFIMNVLSTCAFACSAAAIYKHKHTMGGAIISLIVGCLLMTGVMVLWNYLITPLYMKVDREMLVGLLLPAFMPFNLIKAFANSAISLLLYKPIVLTLRKAGLVPAPETPAAGEKAKVFSPGVVILAVVVLITCLLVVLVFNNVI
ncbi:MAG: ECF transporter S component [Oscillospiraceae bacterium]|nr:ECF transporter S component [Oscillospiraceae bacterium]